MGNSLFSPVRPLDGSGGSFGSQALTRGPHAVSKNVSGLLLAEDWSAPSGWSAGTNWTSGASPGFVCFGYLPGVCLAPGSTLDHGGVRESQILEESGNWYLFYGAGDGSNGVLGHWRPQYAVSANRGKSWTRMGYMLGGDGLIDGSGGEYVCRDFNFLTKIGDTYYLFPLIGDSDVLNSGHGYVPAAPYTTDCWTASSVNGPWTFSRNPTVPLGTAGQFDAFSAYTSAVLKVGSTYYDFYGTNNDGGANNLSVGLASASTPDGVRTKLGNIFSTTQNDVPENPKVGDWTAIGKKFMFLNVGTRALGSTVGNKYLLVDDVTNLSQWDAAVSGAIRFQFSSVAHSLNTFVGLCSPIYNTEGLPHFDANGYMPCTYDTNPFGTTGQDVHVGRSIYWTVLEPSAYAAHYTFSTTPTAVFTDNFNRSNRLLSGDNGWTTLNGTSIAAIVSNQLDLGTLPSGTPTVQNSGTNAVNPVITLDIISAFGPSCGVGFVFRIQDDPNHAATKRWYLLEVAYTNPGGIVYCYLLENGGSNATQVGSDVTFSWDGTGSLTASCVGSTLKLYTGATLQATFTDTTISTTGLCGLREGGGGTGARIVDNFVVTNTPTDTPHRYSKSLSHTDFNAEMAFDFTTDTSGSGGFDYRIQTSSGDSYRVLVNAGGGLTFQKSTGGSGGTPGTFSNLQTTIGTQVTVAQYMHTVKGVILGNVHKWYLDGELQISYTDNSTPYTSGTSIALVGNGVDFRSRLLHLRVSDVVTVTGLVAGQSVTLRAPGGPPVETKTASGSSLTFTETHFPIGSVDVNGADNVVAGYIYGGDTINVAQ